MKQLFFSVFLLLTINGFSQKQFMLIGTYTDKGSKGIYVYSFNSKTGAFDSISSVECNNPSYLAVSPNYKFVYAVTENNDSTKYMLDGGVNAYSFNSKTGKLSFINRESSAGKHPCYVAVDKTGKWLVVGNYTSGSLAVLAVNKTGALDSSKQIITHKGSSINKARQTSPHVHCTIFDEQNKNLFVADLGTDKIYSYQFNNNSGTLFPSNDEFFISEAGSGPRHIAISKNAKYIYVIEELTGTIQVIEKTNQNKTINIQRISSHPSHYNGVIGSADIHISPNGNFLYCSNRGENNTIAIFKVNKFDGKLTNIGFQSTLGLTPRNFNFDPSGNFLLVANQNSNNIVVFKIDKKTGLLSALSNQIHVPNPVCIKWIK